MIKKSEKIAVWITNLVGSINFFWLILLWVIIWLLWNTYMPSILVFDPKPYLLWQFCSNVQQNILMPLLLVSSAIQARKLDRLLHKIEQKDNRILEILIEINKKL